jgi:hypothetical protein
VRQGIRQRAHCQGKEPSAEGLTGITILTMGAKTRKTAPVWK